MDQLWVLLYNFAPIVGLVVLMYVFFIMPQKKRDKKFREMLDLLKVGDKIVTSGGIVGKVINIKDKEITIETSVEKTQIVLIREAIREIIQDEKA